MIIDETEYCGTLSVEQDGVFVYLESCSDSLVIDREQAKQLAVALADYAMTGELP
ncbi:MAG: hypothetical protein RSC43_00695 [Clostridia bacterium]